MTGYPNIGALAATTGLNFGIGVLNDMSKLNTKQETEYLELVKQVVNDFFNVVLDDKPSNLPAIMQPYEKDN